MKSSTKGLIALLTLVVVVAVVMVIVWSTTRAQEVGVYEFYDDFLYSHRVKDDSLKISNDTWTFSVQENTRSTRNYVVYIYSNSDSDYLVKVDNYKAGLDLADELKSRMDEVRASVSADDPSAETTIAEAEAEVTAEWNDYINATRAMGIDAKGTYTEWATAYPDGTFDYGMVNRYGVSPRLYLSHCDAAHHDRVHGHDIPLHAGRRGSRQRLR